MRSLLLVTFIFCSFADSIAQQQFPIKVNSKWGLMDQDGKIITEPIYEAMGQFRQFGYAHIQQNKKVGLINKEGKIIIPPSYNEIQILNQELFAVKNEQWNVIDMFQTPKLQSSYNRIELIAPGFLGIQNQNKCGIAQINGSVICVPTFDEIKAHENYFKIKNDGNIGLMDQSGKIILTPENDNISIFDNKTFLFFRDRKWGVVNENGELVVAAEYDTWKKISDDFIQLKTKGKNYLYSVATSKVLKDHSHTNYLPYSDNKAIFFDTKKAGLMDLKGNILLTAEYDEVMMYTDDLFRVKKNGRWGVMGRDGNSLIPLTYDYISPIRGKAAIVRKDRLSGIASANGEVLLEPLYTKIEISENAIKAFKGAALTLLDIDEEGNLIDEKNFKRHKRIKIGIPQRRIRPMMQSTGRSNLLDNFEWFYDANTTKWGLRRLDNGEYQIEPTFHSINVHQDLGFTIVGIEKLIRQDFERTSYAMQYVYGLVNNERGLLISMINMWDIRTEDFYADLPSARVVFEDGMHGLINESGKVIQKQYGFIGTFHDGVARFSKKGKLSGSTHKNAKGLDVKVADYIEDLETPHYLIDYTKHDLKFEESAVLTCEDCKFGYMDTLGTILIAPNYTFAKNFVNHTGLVEMDGKWGMVDSTGKEVLPCQFKGIRYLENTENKIVEVYNNTKKYGLIDSTGHVNVDISYDAIESCSDERFAVKNNGKWGYTNMTGEEVIPCQYKKVKPFSDTIAAVKKGSKWGFINKSGEEVLPLEFRRAGDFVEDKMWVSRKSKIGFIDKTGKWVIPEQFDKCNNFKNGVAVVAYKGQYGLIDTNGNYIVRPKYKFISEFNEHDLAIVKFGNNKIKQGVINQSGEVITKKSYNSIAPYQEGMAVVKTEKGYGAIDNYGRLVVETKYTSFSNYSEGKAAVQRNGKWGFVDKKGNEIIPLEFSKCLDYKDGIAVVYKGYRKAGLIDADGNYIIEPSINRMVDFSNGRGKVRSADRSTYYFIGSNATVADISYDMASDYQHGVAAVKSGNYWGIINTQGIELISPKFEKIENYQSGYAKVRINRLYGLANLKGEVIVAPDYEFINYAGNGLFRVERGDRIGYFDWKGKWVWELNR